MNQKKKSLILSIIGILGLITITAGVTYAFFNYVKEGTTDNTVTTGTITFLYTEVSGVGKGISLSDAYPISDNQGKAQTGEGKVFDFKITSTTPNKSSIPYEVTARKKDTSTLDESAVKLYLTKVSGKAEEEVLLDNYSNLDQTTRVNSNKYIEKTIYTGKVPADSTNYEQNFRLRMWIDDSIDFSPVKDEQGNDTYPYNNKEFTVTVNVYANAKVVTDEDIENESKAEISNITVDGTELTKVENGNYDYETSLPEGTTSTTINIETISENATVKIERIDSLVYSSNIKRLSTKNTLELSPGNNYFKITVISENKEVENEYKINIKVGQTGTLLSDAIFSKYTTIYDNPTLGKTSEEAGENGLYKSTATNFNGVEGTPTYYFRGNVENYLDFAGFTWRVVRINEDRTIRIVMQDGGIDSNKPYAFNKVKTNKENMYYSKSDTAKSILNSWYSSKIESNSNYSNKVATGNYFCEQAKVAFSSSYATKSGANMVVYSSYKEPNFKCEKDANDFGIVNASIGLLSYDEVLHAGGYVSKENNSYYLYNGATSWWMMSPSGFSGSIAFDWYVTVGKVSHKQVTDTTLLRPVLNLKANITVTGTGASDDHWIVQ